MDLFNLSNKVAIVTGGASGIGKAVVKLFSQLNIRNVIVDLEEESGRIFAQKLQQEGNDALFIQADISNNLDVENVISKTHNEFQRIDILVNCAGVSGLSSYLELIEEEWDWTIQTNVKGTHLMCLEVAKKMVEYNIKGRIVNISSINDQIPVAGLSSYAVSKAAISGLTRAIALELAPYGINVNTIRPAAIDTPMMKEVLELPELAQAILRQIPRGRIGHPSDVAKAVLFLVSDLSEWITGAEIPVTGGMHLVGETSYNYYFEREMTHEENLPDIPFTRPWKRYNLEDFKKKE
ncbi:MAG: SDR family oxidoreductase [Candidatus Heimdallarchaeota archaeon]|nr:SDR family oxidoreductase [Candidatus Heimdallarchaeota archaeon]